MTTERPQLRKLLTTASASDTVIIPAIDRLSRDTADLLTIASDLKAASVGLRSLLAPNRPATFLWRVSGTSMVEIGIHDGDVVVVDRSTKPEDGSAVVACIDGTVSASFTS